MWQLWQRQQWNVTDHYSSYIPVITNCLRDFYKYLFAIATSNMTAIVEVQSASFRLVLQAQHSFFLQMLLIFSSSKGYWLQISIPRAYFVYMIWHCTGQHCSSMSACTYHLSVVRGECYTTLLHCNYFSSPNDAKCGIARFLCAMRVYSKFGHHPHP